MKKYLLTFSLAALLVLSIVPRFTFADTQRLLVVGDSISSAYGMDINDGWVALLQERIDFNGYNVEVVNASITGDLSGSGNRRIASLLEQHQPKWTLIELGGNDGLRGLPIKHIKNNLNAMVEQAQDNDSQAILVGMQIFPNYGPKYTAAFKTAYYDVADQTGAALVPFILKGVGGVTNLNQADGIHPNEEAQAILLDNVWSVLEPLISTH